MRKKVSPPREASTPTTALLVIVELGGEWPQLALVQPAAAASSRRVVAQVDGETPAAFAERVANSLDSLFDRGIKLDTVLLASNERLDEAAATARRRIASLALGRMAIAKHMSGRVYLTAAPRSSGRLRHALSSLAHGLFDEWRTAGLEVSVDFGDERAEAPEAAPFAFTSRVA
jgi:hypothetical protein